MNSCDSVFTLFLFLCIMTDSHMEMWNSLKYDQHKSATLCKAPESSQAEMKNKKENSNMNVGFIQQWKTCHLTHSCKHIALKRCLNVILYFQNHL